MQKMDNWIDNARKQREIAFEPKYGPIRPKSDPGCFRREALEELIDALNYTQWAKMKGEINQQQWKKMDSGIKAVIRTIETACADKFEWEMAWMK